VLHEFSSIPGVREDVTDIVLNIKTIAIRSQTDQPNVALAGSDGELHADLGPVVQGADHEVGVQDLDVADGADFRALPSPPSRSTACCMSSRRSPACVRT
jgi:DNA-directed RNA polymerase subunit alpha